MAKQFVGEYFKNNGNLIEWRHKMLSDNRLQQPAYDRRTHPNATIVKHYTAKFNEKYSFDKSVLDLIFERFNDIKNKEHIFIRILSLNSLYSTELDRDKMILLCDVLVSHANAYLTSDYNSDIVNELCEDFNSAYSSKCNKSYSPYSFVSKYFSQINNQEYPRYDSYVTTMLKWYRYLFADEFTFADDDLRSYHSYKTILTNFISSFCLNCNLDEIDMFLWTAGKEFFPLYIDNNIINDYKK